MLRWIKTRLVVEKPSSHDKYYPTILRATTQKSYPFSVSYAEIEVAANVVGSTAGYISQFRFDDIVRLQVSIKMNPNEYTVWQDIFQGRIMDMYSEFGNNSNNVKLYCQGHEVEATTAIIGETYAFATPTDVRTVIDYYETYLSRLTYSADYADSGISFPTYDSTANQTYMSDLFSDAEKVSGYTYAIKAIPTYSGGNLSTIYIGWNELSDTVSDKYKIIEGTSRVLDADFSVEGSSVRTAYRVIGDSCAGYDYDSTLSTLYGLRTEVDNESWVKSEDLADAIAGGILADIKTPEVSGHVVIIGTPEADIGDLVYCKLPSIELNGSSVDGNYTVYRVEHNITDNEFTTTLDLGKIRKTAYDYYADTVKTLKTVKKNQI